MFWLDLLVTNFWDRRNTKRVSKPRDHCTDQCRVACALGGRGETWSDRWFYLQISYCFSKKFLFSPIYIICEIIYREAQAYSEDSPKPWVNKWSSWGSLYMSALWAWAVCWEKKAKWPQSTGDKSEDSLCPLQNAGDKARAVLRAVELQGRRQLFSLRPGSQRTTVRPGQGEDRD